MVKRWGGLVAIALLVSGCEFLDQISPYLPPQLQPSSQPIPGGSVQTASTAKMEDQVRQQINAIRQEKGLSQLRHNERLAEVARSYSRRMAEEDFFAHVSPKGDTPAQRVQSAGIFYLLVGENLFTSTNIPQPVPAAIDGWMKSRGHRENILRPEYRETGIGVWRRGNTYYITQLFMRSLQG